MSRQIMSVPELREKSEVLARRMYEMCVAAGTGHISSSLSCMDILTVLYYVVLNHDPEHPDDPERDRFILSKGQASPGLYTVLADCEYFPPEWMAEFAKPNAHFGVHLQNTVPGVEMSTGSLGMGLGIAAGMALGLKLKRALPMVYCLLGDAECYEGSVWEAAMFASHNRLTNLVAIVDRNALGATDFTESMCKLDPLEDKFAAFGWSVERMSGHDIPDLVDQLDVRLRGRRTVGPTMVICDTVKGRGVPYMENAPLWHSRVPVNKTLIEYGRSGLEGGTL